MGKDLIFILQEFLKVNNYGISEESLSLELTSHPDFPSMKSITDTLSVLEIDNLAVQLSGEAFDKIDQPVLANVVVNDKPQMVLVLSNNDEKVELCRGASKEHLTSIAKSDFTKIWTGNIVAIDKSKKRPLRKLPKELLLIPVLVLGLVLRFIQQPFSIAEVVFALLVQTGLVVSYLIYKVSNDKTGGSKYCLLGKKPDCSSVIQSGKKLPFLDWGLSDLGLIYFVALYFSLVANVELESFAQLSFLSLPVVIYSWYQQIFVVRKLCVLCLVLSLVLIGQASLYAFVESSFFNYASDQSLILFAIGLISTLWYYLKPQLGLLHELPNLKQELRAFKRNYHLFIPYYQSAPQLPHNLNLSDITLGGSADAPVKIQGITNPLCNSCFEVHNMYESLIRRYPEQVQVNLLFYVPVDDLNDPRTQVAARMVKSSVHESRNEFDKLMADWYDLNNMRKWSKVYKSGLPDTDSLQVLKMHKDWCHAHSIQSTPALFVNGKRFPRFYDPVDLENFIEELISFESSKKSCLKELTPQIVGVN